MTRKKAVVAMSGGVDSSVAAALLVEQGYDVTGIMLKLWRGEMENNDSGCCNVGAAADARRVADALDIPFYVLNFAERFEDTVIEDFNRSYTAGVTPNPCVRCNQWIKFDALLERADALGADVLATGHYARLRRGASGFQLLRGVDQRKDQSYVLWMLSQDQLARCLFPVGELEKTETRRIAAELGLRTAAKPDSQEICFVRGGDLGRYIEENVPDAAADGAIFDTSGQARRDAPGDRALHGGPAQGPRHLAGGTGVRDLDRCSVTTRWSVGSRSELGVGRIELSETSAVSDSAGSG